MPDSSSSSEDLETLLSQCEEEKPDKWAFHPDQLTYDESHSQSLMKLQKGDTDPDVIVTGYRSPQHARSVCSTGAVKTRVTLMPLYSLNQALSGTVMVFLLETNIAGLPSSLGPGHGQRDNLPHQLVVHALALALSLPVLLL